MNLLEPYISDEVVKALGWAFLHSLWIGALLGVFFLCVQWLLRNSTANKKYIIGLCFMLLMPMMVAFAFFDAYQEEVAYPSEAYLKQIRVTNIYQASPTPLAESYSQEERRWLDQLKSVYFERYHSILVGVWLLGITLYSLHQLGGYFYTNRLRRHGLAGPTDQIRKLFARLLKQTAVKRNVELMESFLIKAPVVIGTFRPMVLLPVGLAAGLTMSEIEAILAHEIAHIRRNDFLANILQSCVEVVFFFHPAIWIIGSSVRSERENCCDDLAVAINGDRIGLARALAHVEEWRQLDADNTFALGFSGPKNSLLNRIKRIINNKNMKTQENKTGYLLGNLLVIGLITGLSLTTLTSLKSIDYYTSGNSGERKLTLSQKSQDTLKTKEKSSKAEKDKAKNKEKVKPKDKAKEKSKSDVKNTVVYDAADAGFPPSPATVSAPATAVASVPVVAPAPVVALDWSRTVDAMPALPAMTSMAGSIHMAAMPAMPPFPPAGAVLSASAVGGFHLVIPGAPFSFSDDQDSTFRRSQEEFARQMEAFAKEMAAVQSELGKEMAARAAEMSKMAAELASEMEHKSMHEWREHQEEMAHHQREMAMEQAEMARHQAEMQHEMGEHHREEMKRHEEEMRKHSLEMSKLEEELKNHEKKAKAFEQDLRVELIKDGIISSSADRIKLKINKDELVINGQKQGDEMYKKYRRFIKEKWDSGISLEDGDTDEFSLSFSY